MKNPCYNEHTKTDCPKRKAGCASSCPEWQEYILKRNAVYKKKTLERTAETLTIDGNNRRRKAKGYK